MNQYRLELRQKKKKIVHETFLMIWHVSFQGEVMVSCDKDYVYL